MQQPLYLEAGSTVGLEACSTASSTVGTVVGVAISLITPGIVIRVVPALELVMSAAANNANTYTDPSGVSVPLYCPRGPLLQLAPLVPQHLARQRALPGPGVGP